MYAVIDVVEQTNATITYHGYQKVLHLETLSKCFTNVSNLFLVDVGVLRYETPIDREWLYLQLMVLFCLVFRQCSLFLFFFPFLLVLNIWLFFFLCNFFLSLLVGNTLYLNTKETQTRPKTADTVRSNSTNKEEYSVFPYENTTSANQTPRQQTRGHKSAPPIRVNTWKHVSSDKDGWCIFFLT